MPNDIANNMVDTIHQLEKDRIMLSTQLTDLQLAYNEQMLELKEAKRLLKSAIDEWNLVCEWGNCGEYCGWFKNGKCSQKWSGEAEALKLIGEDGERNE